MLAMGSLLALSSSITSLSLRFNATFRVLNIEKTAAASVDETTAPKSRDSSKVKPLTRYTKPPTATQVSNTPKVASETPSAMTGFMDWNLVFKPP